MCAERRRARKRRPRQPVPETLPDDLFDYADDPAPRRSPPPHAFDVEKLPVIDDWPEDVPITEAEIQVFERWFADVFDEMFGSLDPVPGFTNLSRDDRDKE